jgi:hypothetical protein
MTWQITWGTIPDQSYKYWINIQENTRQAPDKIGTRSACQPGVATCFETRWLPPWVSTGARLEALVDAAVRRNAPGA